MDHIKGKSELFMMKTFRYYNSFFFRYMGTLQHIYCSKQGLPNIEEILKNQH